MGNLPNRFNHHEDESDQETQQPRCCRCGSTDVRWRQQGGKWVLFSLRPGVEHTCPTATLGAVEDPDA